MSRIYSCTSQTDNQYWIQTNQQLIQKHPAWHKDVDAWQAEALLAGKAPFTYLLRKGDKEQSYFITFVKEDHSVYHQLFTLEYDRRGWYYKNGGPVMPVEIIDELIPQMMHCDPKECIVLGRS